MPTPETDLILARYVGTLTKDGWGDFLPVVSDAAVVRFLTDLRGSAAVGRSGHSVRREGPLGGGSEAPTLSLPKDEA